MDTLYEFNNEERQEVDKSLLQYSKTYCAIGM